MTTYCISRTDNLGDVILTLPLAGFLKQNDPDANVLFLGKSYTRPIIDNCADIDEFINWDKWDQLSEENVIVKFKSLNIDFFYHVFPNKKIAKIIKKVGVPNRVGTSHRIFHWLTCNNRVSFTRKDSDLHEAQLNFELLKPHFKMATPTMEDLSSWTVMNPIRPSPEVQKLIDLGSLVLLHAKSKGSAVEWGVENFVQLSHELSSKGFTVLFTGSKDEGEIIRPFLNETEDIRNICGMLSLEELISLIQNSQTLIACSTGPLHIAAATGIQTIGLFSTMRPIHPGRWHPIGSQAITLVSDQNEMPGVIKKDASDLARITVKMVLDSM